MLGIEPPYHAGRYTHPGICASYLPGRVSRLYMPGMASLLTVITIMFDSLMSV